MSPESKTLMLNITRQRNFYRSLTIALFALLTLAVTGGLYMVGDANTRATAALTKSEEYRGQASFYEEMIADLKSEKGQVLTALTAARKENIELRAQITEKADEVARLSTTLATRELELAEKSKSFFDFATKTEPKSAPVTPSQDTAVSEKSDSWLDKTGQKIGKSFDDAYHSVTSLFERK